MKRSLFIPGALVLAAPVFAAQTIIPEPFPEERYAKMIESEPFKLATAPVAPVEKGPGPFAQLFVAAIARFNTPEGKQEDVVTVKSRADQSTFTLSGTEPNKEGYQIAGIEWSEKVGASKVTIKKGTEFGTLEFDQANLQAAPQAAARPQPGVPQPGGPNAAGIPRGGARLPVVPRPGSVAPVPAQPQPQGQLQPQQALPGQAPNVNGAAPVAPQRRVRVINAKP